MAVTLKSHVFFSKEMSYFLSIYLASVSIYIRSKRITTLRYVYNK